MLLYLDVFNSLFLLITILLLDQDEVALNLIMFCCKQYRSVILVQDQLKNYNHIGTDYLVINCFLHYFPQVAVLGLLKVFAASSRSNIKTNFITPVLQ